MGLKLRLEWYDKLSETLVSSECSRDFHEDDSIVNKLGLPIQGSVNSGMFDVEIHWVEILGPYFIHEVQLNNYDYQVAFDYDEATC